MTRVHRDASTLAPDTLYVTAGDQNLQPGDVRDSLDSAEVDEGASMHIYTLQGILREDDPRLSQIGDWCGVGV